MAEYTQAQFTAALNQLSTLLSMDQTLIHYRKLPLNLIVVGGFVSVSVLRNRPATHDIDYTLIHDTRRPSDWMSDTHSTDTRLGACIMEVADALLMQSDWANSHVDLMLPQDPLFDRIVQLTMAQNCVIYSSPSLILRAVDLSWMLVNKLKMIGDPVRGDRGQRDLDDALHAARAVYTQGGLGRPILRSSLVQRWEHWVKEIPAEKFAAVNHISFATWNISVFNIDINDTQSEEMGLALMASRGTGHYQY